MGDPLGEVTGMLEERDGRFHLLSGFPDAITALLLISRHDGAPQRLVYDLERTVGSGALPPPPQHERAPERVARSTKGWSKGGGGETLTERAERLARRDKR